MGSLGVMAPRLCIISGIFVAEATPTTQDIDQMIFMKFSENLAERVLYVLLKTYLIAIFPTVVSIVRYISCGVCFRGINLVQHVLKYA